MVRVFIYSSHSLFGAGFEKLLRGQSDIEIVGRASDLDLATGWISALKPDLIVVVGHSHADDTACVIARLSETVKNKIISINLESNAVWIIGEQQPETKVEYLIQVIQAEMLTTNSEKAFIRRKI